MADQRKFLILCGLGVLFVAALLWPACARAQFVKGDEEARLRAMIPLEKFRDDPRLLIYTHRTIPRIYQFAAFNSGNTSFHDVHRNISADSDESPKGHDRGGNGGVEFPWRHTAGLDNCPTGNSYKFISLPKEKPIVWYRKTLHEPFGSSLGYGWTFPVGAIVGEVITQRSPQGYDFTFEVRTRERLKDSWTVDIFRPFPTAEDFLKALKAARPQWEKEPQLVALVKHLETPTELPSQRLADRNHRTKMAFNSVASVDKLPTMNEDVAAALLTSTPFKSALGETWRNNRCFAPTTDARFHIIPTNYQATFAGTDDQSCSNCHSSTSLSVRVHDANRGWYGWHPGSDQIISFHPVDPSCVIGDASDGPVRMRSIPNVIEHYDPERHTSGYHALKR